MAAINKSANVARDIGGLVIETQHSGAKIVLKMLANQETNII